MNSAQHAESGQADASGERGAHLLQDCPQHLLPDLPRATTENRRPISRATNNMRETERDVKDPLITKVFLFTKEVMSQTMIKA